MEQMKSMEDQINRFLEETRINLELKDGKPHYGGYLDLRGTSITSLPEGLTVGGWLDLSGTGITSLPEGLTVGGNLYLRGTSITSLPEGLTVGGNLYLRGTSITSLPEVLTVGGYLDLRGTSITSLPEVLTVGGYLDLRGTSITSLPEVLTVGGYLDLRGTSITSLPEGLTVGGYLDLSGTGITSLPEGLTVGGNLYLIGTGITDTTMVNHTFKVDITKRIWDGKKYICVDGIFTEVISHKGNVWIVRKIASKKEIYIVTDGEGHYAHGDTLDDARNSLVYKICDRDKSEYENMKPEDTLTFQEAVTCYRVITGACAAGTRDFVENCLSEKDRKDEYTIAEICRLTEGKYGNETFRKFFCKNR